MRSSTAMNKKTAATVLEKLTPAEDAPIPWFEGVLEADDDDDMAADTAQRPPRPGPPPPAPPKPQSRRLGTDHVDEGEIARGGMGSIRRLYDPSLRRRVAMKVLEYSDSNDARQRFIDEARLTGLLEHPNIVPVHDLVIDARGEVTYSMKLVAGETLSVLIARQRSVRDLEHILECIIKVCEALSFAHGLGVLHRDLKPDNVMIGTHGQVYVMDWGCAHAIGEARSIVDGRSDADGMVAGTVAYMAPEQAQGLVSQLDARADVFGVGAILYAVLTGGPPYTGNTMAALSKAQLAEVRPPDEACTSALKPPPHLSQIAMKAMALDPVDRFQSTEELAAALREFLKGGNWFPLQLFVQGAVIVREGDPAEAAYIITRGRCEVRKTDPKDPSRTLLLRTMGVGDVFGETAIFADAPRSASVIAIENVSAVVVERAAIERLTNSSWLGMFVKALAARFLDVDARLSARR